MGCPQLVFQKFTPTFFSYLRFNFALQFICTLWRCEFKSTSPERLFAESATVKRRFFCRRSVLMTAFIVNEQPVSGGCYGANCPLFKGPSLANSAKARYCMKETSNRALLFTTGMTSFHSAPRGHPANDDAVQTYLILCDANKIHQCRALSDNSSLL